VRVALLTVSDLLSGRYVFRLPWFQRAYAWQTQNVSRLLANVAEANEAGAGHYMLGNVMLARAGEPGPDTALVDGQQRLVSLTILFAVLRDLEPDAGERQWLHGLIAGHPAGGDTTRTAYWLAPQATLAEFLEAYVQSPGSTVVEPDEDRVRLSETEQNIIENRDFLRAALLGEMSDDERRRLARFLAHSCHLVVTTAECEEEAWEMLRIEEETRLAFDETACAKASLLGVMPPDQRSRAALLWDECERLLGSADTHALLGHVRTLHMRRRSAAPLEADICRNFALDRTGAAFMEDVLLPHSKSLADIRRLSEGASASHPAAAAALAAISWVNDQVWIPAALHWLSLRGLEDPQSAEFFRRLDRLVWFMRLAGVDPDRQETRIIRLLRQIETIADVPAIAELDIEARLRNPALKILRSVSFRAKKFAPAVLRRLSVELGDDPHQLGAHDALTIEHILPLSPPASRQWHQHFRSRASVKSYTNRLGNLTLLTFDENQAAGSADWDAKRQVLASSKIALAREAAEQSEWRAAEIDARTERLIRILFNAWQVPV